MNKLLEAAKAVLELHDDPRISDINVTFYDAMDSLRQAVQEAVSIPDLDDIAYQCDQHGDWVVDLHEVKAIVNRLSNPYTPMTDDELQNIVFRFKDAFTGQFDSGCLSAVERAVIERLGLVWCD